MRAQWALVSLGSEGSSDACRSAGELGLGREESSDACCSAGELGKEACESALGGKRVLMPAAARVSSGKKLSVVAGY